MTSGSPSHPRIILFLFRAVVLSNCAALCLGNSKDDVVHTVSSWCPNAFFNFGDSLSDTGNYQRANPGSSNAENLPYGEEFFGKPSGRSSNGRLVIDFILMSFKLPLLDPYLLADANGMHGLNFAFAGATATKDTSQPYSVGYEVDEFTRLKNRVLQKQPQQFVVDANGMADANGVHISKFGVAGKTATKDTRHKHNRVLQTQPQQFLAHNLNRVDPAIFDTALYMICIGGNDIVQPLFQGILPEALVKDAIPNIVQDMENAVQKLYFQGARKFLLFNGPPKGCASTVLSALDGLDLPVDNAGCIIAVNELDQALNREHFKSVQRLRASLPNVTIIYFDYYAANFEIARNPSKYGLDPNRTHRACCGAPGCGILNVSPTVKCGLPGSNRCDDPNQYIYWDGQHFTESFYRQIAKFVLNGEFSDPPINLTKLCNLTFEEFGRHKTYAEVFPRTSSRLFDE